MTWLLSFLVATTMSTSMLPATVPFDEVSTRKTFVRTGGDENIRTEQSYPLNPDGRVSVGNINGSIKVQGWDRPEVKLISNKVSNLRERLDDIEINIESSPGRFKVEVDYKRKKNYWKRGDKLYVNFSLMVPKTALVDEIESVNGSITVDDLDNYTRVSAVNGGVKASGLRGEIHLSTVNGSVIATLDKVAPESNIALETVNGSVRLTLPSDINATVKADSVNGSIRNGFGLPVKVGKYVGRDLYGRIGSGSARVRLNSVNGSISVNRLEDGLTMNPVVNLLPSKTSDDFDDSFKNDLRMARETARRASSAAVVAARAAIEAASNEEIDEAVVEEAVRKAIKETEKIDAEEIKLQIEEAERIAKESKGIETDVERSTLASFGNRRAPFLVEDSKTVKVVGMQEIDVTAYGSEVSVKAWDRDEIRYKITRIARGQSSAVKNVEFTQKKSGVRLSVWLKEKPTESELLDQVRIELRVPEKSNLKISTDREIRLEGVEGNIKLIGKYGGINVRDSAGALNVYSKTGIVRIIGFEGSVESNAGSGDVYLEGDFDAIHSFSKASTVYLSVTKDHNATIKTNSMGYLSDEQKDGSNLDVEGLTVRKQSDGIWAIGNGKSEFNFKFARGHLILIPGDALATDD